MQPIEKIRVGKYLIIGNHKDYRVMEQFGDYRMLKKVFKTVEQAKARIATMQR